LYTATPVILRIFLIATIFIISPADRIHIFLDWKECSTMLIPTNTPDAPAAIGPYSQAIRFQNLLFTSGQIPLDPATGEVAGEDIATQAELVMRNLGAVLKANGIGYDNVIKTTCFLADMKDFATFNQIYAKYFVSNKPARSCVAVRELPKGVLCEVEAVAAIEE
jgi:2-iminobutanoate/2-iminopropanoate deaminase